MATDSKISWCDHSFAPWFGCSKISKGCRNCYAARWAARSGMCGWGSGKLRRRSSENYWRQPKKWNALAVAGESRGLVFGGHLCDVFDQVPQVAQWRRDFFWLIQKTPALTWLLLTKRPGAARGFLRSLWGDEPWDNVWIGVTAETQTMADKRIPILLDIMAVRRFVSVEPMLTVVSLHEWLHVYHQSHQDDRPNRGWRVAPLWEERYADTTAEIGPEIDWVICGGETGPGYRKMQSGWARVLRDQCGAAGVPFFFKQSSALTPGQADVLEGRQYKAVPCGTASDCTFVPF